jgi:hypothetical protein
MFYSTKSMRSYGVVAQWHERPVSPADVVAAAAEHDKVAGAERAVMFQAEKRETAAVVGVPVTVGTVSRQRGKLDALAKTRPPLAETMAVEDEKGQNLRVHIRGNHLTLGAEAPRRFPRIMAGDSALSLAEDRSGRLEFANWVASPNNSLTARVMANRIWAGHFGEGLVRSTDNFGRLGARPTHPELLDWLAHEFVKSRWSVKHMHRLIVTSAAYQSSYRDDVTAFQTDPENKLLWRFNRRRLDAEEVRDSMLATSGLLDRKIGGSLLTVQNRAYVTSTANRNYDVYSEPRRSVYLPVIRSAGYDVLQTFDFPDPSVPNGSRATTTIPTQALMLLNSPLADRTSEAFAKSLLWIPVGDEARIREAYRRALGRKPSEKELNRVVDYLAKSEQASDVILPPETRRFLAWRGFCRVLMASNEFAYVE